MDRREFLKTTAIVGAVAAVGSKLHGAAKAAENAVPSPAAVHDLVAVRNGDPVAMFRKGIEALGGMKSFVKPGQSVLVKPNIGWNKTPEEGANTNPELVAEIVRQALAAGASKVEVFDNTCNLWTKCYAASGIAEAVKAAGGKMLDSPNDKASRDEYYTEVERPAAVVMKKAYIYKAVLSADVFINVPVLKHHGGAKMTSAMKNFMGIVYDRKYMHSNNLPQCIADSVLYRIPDLNVVDAYRVMVARGPRGVSLEDVKLMKYQLLSRDIVAIDAMSSKVIGFPMDDIKYIALAEKMGLGYSDPAKFKTIRLEV